MSHLNIQNWERGAEPTVSYETWTKEELQAELESRDLPKTGNKPELISRLEEDDAH